MNAFEALDYLYQEANYGSLEKTRVIDCFKKVEKSLTRLQRMENNIKYAKANFRMDLADAELIDFIENGLVTND